ncbi:TPA: response regulator transcription factor [Candidatus Micrarchaeota archaeon]|nr:response regulator transcription factor [Candidatus Micrarchaeota archaeon]HIH30242.1 response regulator transcription factor [Candidatus Micrarchaeota archaeon]
MKKILIVEDEPDVAETMKMLIERDGYQCDYCLNPVEGLEKMKGYDLLLLDIMMPRMSGRQVLEEMKKRGIAIPVIVVSAVGLPLEVASELGKVYPGVDFVPKTEMHTDLIRAIVEKIGK